MQKELRIKTLFTKILIKPVTLKDSQVIRLDRKKAYYFIEKNNCKPKIFAIVLDDM